MKKLAIILAGLAIGNMVFAAKISVSPLKVSYNQITTDSNGNLQQTVISDNGMSITIGAELEDETLKYTLSLDNIPDSDYLLRSDCIKTYYGNFEKDEWTENTSSAYSNTQTQKTTSSDSEISAAEACVIAGATCLCALTLFEICNSSTSSSSSSTRVSSSSNRVNRVPAVAPSAPRRSTTTIVTPAPIFNWVIIDNSTKSSSSNSTRTVEPYTTVTPGMTDSVTVGSSYRGVFYVPAGLGPDYRVRFIVSKNEYIDFYFSRSDRDNVANPMKDRNYGRHSILLSAGIPDFNRFGGYYIYSGKTVGVYTGISIQSQNWDLKNAAYMDGNFDNLTVEDFVPYPAGGNNYNCDYRLVNIDNSKTVTDIVDFTLGLTIKTVPHTWLMLGCGLDIGMNHYYGTIQGIATSSDYEDLTIGYVQDNVPIFAAAPQVGVNVILDHLDIAATYQYSFIDGSKFDLMIGIAF